jgi:hypothetical protein
MSSFVPACAVRLDGSSCLRRKIGWENESAYSLYRQMEYRNIIIIIIIKFSGWSGS